jgi:serine/threonine protein phosphatase PrpC
VDFRFFLRKEARTFWPRAGLLPFFMPDKACLYRPMFLSIIMKPKTNYRLTIATATHKGDRDYQQDRVEVLQHPYEKQCFMVVLADGMGGRSGAAQAARQVVESARELFKQFDVEKDDPAAMLRQLVVDAHAVIRMLNISSELEPHSTIAVHLLLPSGADHWVHSGDSRIYHFRKGQLLMRTHDHSYVQGLIDKGEISEKDAIGHEKSNLLTGCLGMDTAPPIAQAFIEQIEIGDAVLSCTDGLWAYFSEEELAKMAYALTPVDACKQLLEKARTRAAGKGDNVSLAILKATAMSTQSSG